MLISKQITHGTKRLCRCFDPVKPPTHEQTSLYPRELKSKSVRFISINLNYFFTEAEKLHKKRHFSKKIRCN